MSFLIRSFYVLLVCLAAYVLGSHAYAWELRVCAQPFAFPLSSDNLSGINNEIAKLVANDLGADLSFEWTRFDSGGLQSTLLSGECDVAFGVSEGALGLETTVPYVRIPYVFAWLGEREIEVDSLDSPALADLKIGTYADSLIYLSLQHRGLDRNVQTFPLTATPGGPNYTISILEALERGDIDIAIVFGSDLIAYLHDRDTAISWSPVEPEVDVGVQILQHFRIYTAGVRPFDTALRDQVESSLARNWNEIRTLIETSDIPELPIDAPTPSESHVTKIGLVAPMPTDGGYVPEAEMGIAAFHGLRLAENLAARTSLGREVQFITANAPNLPAAVRATDRLIALDNVEAIIAFADTAASVGATTGEAEGSVLVFNLGPSTPDRQLCLDQMIYVDAGTEMYVRAALGFQSSVDSRWFVVYSDEGGGSLLPDVVSESIRLGRGEGKLVGSASVSTTTFAYSDIVRKILNSGADRIVLSLPFHQLDFFLSQLRGLDTEPIVFPVLSAREQLLSNLYRLRTYSAMGLRLVFPVLWDPSLEAEARGPLNDVFLARTSVPMNSIAWASYAAATAALELIGDPGAASTNWTSPLSLDLGKEDPIEIDRQTGQLNQTVYLVETDTAVEWSPLGRDRTALLKVVGSSYVRASPRASETCNQ